MGAKLVFRSETKIGLEEPESNISTSVVRDELTSAEENPAGPLEGAVCSEYFLARGRTVGDKGGKWERERGVEGSGGSGGWGGGWAGLPPAVGGNGCRPEVQLSENQWFCIGNREKNIQSSSKLIGFKPII